MTKILLSDLSDQALIEEFAGCARAWGDDCELGRNGHASKMVGRLMKLSEELRARGRSATIGMIPLLDSTDAGVRYHAALELLTLVPDRARAELTAIGWAGLPGISFTARMTLSGLDDGDREST